MAQAFSRITRSALTGALLLTVFSAPLAHAQYASNRTVMNRIDSLERNVMLLQRQLAKGEGYEGETIPMGSDVPSASVQVRFGEMEETLRALQGQIEQLDFQNRQLKTQLERATKDMEFRLNALEQNRAGMAQASPEPNSPQPATGGAPTYNDNPEEEPVTTEGAEYAPEPAEPPKPDRMRLAGEETGNDPAALKFASAREHYNHAFKLLNQTQYDQAGAAFTAFVKKYPKDPLTGNAFYWLGETYYVRKDFVKAADSFRQGFESMPSGPKSSDNLLKLSMSLDALGRGADACVVLKQIVAKYGKNSSSIKQKAEQEIGRMRCE